MSKTRTGTAWKFEDDINTDYIISSKRKRDTLDCRILSKFLMEDIRPGFGREVTPGDFIVGGNNFGCGSAMEIATTVILAAGVAAVIAKSFSRTFFRNGINGGLLLLKADTDSIDEKDNLSLALKEGVYRVYNHTKNETVQVEGVSAFLTEITRTGGLISYLSKNNGFSVTDPCSPRDSDG